ncbi:hypothetical protein MRB53_039044 [Persea americana]|nr:hypothetical protein MRB53_039044 [Persea americana]
MHASRHVDAIAVHYFEAMQSGSSRARRTRDHSNLRPCAVAHVLVTTTTPTETRSTSVRSLCTGVKFKIESYECCLALTTWCSQQSG